MNKALIATVLCAATAHANVFQFDLLGMGGTGLLPFSEVHDIDTSIPPGSGGEVGPGISYNDVSNQLSINIGWGLVNGFITLTDDARSGHIHGRATLNQTAGVLHTLSSLPGWDPSAISGGFSGTVTLTEPQELMLMAGGLYINIHTALNPAGEIRGNLVPVAVPEPGETCAVIAGALGVFALARRIRGRMA